MRGHYVLILFLPALLLLIPVWKQITRCHRLNCIDMNGLENYSLSQTYLSGRNVSRQLYKNNGQSLRTQINSAISQEDFLRLEKENIANISSFYQEAFAPYPGEISNTVKCDPGRIPRVSSIKTGSVSVTYYSSFLNVRLVPACNSSEDKFISVTAFFYCQNQKGYQLQFISPLAAPVTGQENTVSALKTVSCR